MNLLRERNLARATDVRLVRQLVEQRLSGRTMRFEQEFEELSKSLTVAEVAKALKDHLDAHGRMVTVMAGPFKKAAAIAVVPARR